MMLRRSADKVSNIRRPHRLTRSLGAVVLASTLSAGGMLLASTGAGAVSGLTVASELNGTDSIFVDSAGNIYSGSRRFGTVQKTTPTGLTTTLARGMQYPGLFTMDSLGNLYAANTNSSGIVKITPSGTASTFATPSYPTGMAFGPNGNLYVTEYFAGDVMEIDTGGSVANIISVPAPHAIVFDAEGNAYITSYGNGEIYKIPAGIHNAVSFATTPGALADQLFMNPSGTTIYETSVGNDFVNQIDVATGAVTTLATDSSLAQPCNGAVDSTGNLFIGPCANHVIVKITPAGVVSTVFTDRNIGALFASGSLLYVGQKHTVQLFGASSPSAPSQVKAKPHGSRVKISWQAPSSNGGARITRYKVSMSPGGKSCKTSRHSCTIKKLSTKKRYTVKVRAMNAAGTGPAAILRHVKG
ncbi:MAG: fibronectin type III domain-containing protein [Actinobacteria bacterium]|nr:fibronectin type III domain-containing protein [Actinomycetota bacterium]